MTLEELMTPIRLSLGLPTLFSLAHSQFADAPALLPPPTSFDVAQVERLQSSMMSFAIHCTDTLMFYSSGQAGGYPRLAWASPSMLTH